MAQLENEALMGAWQQFKETRSLEARNALILHYASLVRYVAAKVGAGLPSMVDREDLVSYGQFGLIEALDGYDLERGVKFETYAVARIRGSIIDALRKLDWVPRGVRSKARAIEQATSELQIMLGRPPEDSELAEHMGITVHELWSQMSQTSAALTSGLDEESEDHASISDVTFDVASNPEDIFAAGEVTDLMAEAISSMPERYKTILVLYYLQEMTLAEIGAVLGVTESRVCQLQSKVLQALRDSLGQGALSAA
jgi:RNA polymerase sigma factor for flagellar operon FliA